MIITTIRITAPLDKLDEFWYAVRRWTGPIGVEPGCLSCRVYHDAQLENALVIIQE